MYLQKEYTRATLLKRENKKAVERLYKEWVSLPFEPGAYFPGYEDEANSRLISWKYGRASKLEKLVDHGDVSKIKLILNEDQKRCAEFLSYRSRKFLPEQQELIDA